jgi:hypothetical protein
MRLIVPLAALDGRGCGFRLLESTWTELSVASAMLCSRRCRHSIEAICSCPGSVGRWSCGFDAVGGPPHRDFINEGGG